MPQSTVLAPVFDMMRITFIIGAVILAAVFLARSISKPIITVAETLKDISEGEGDLTRTIPVKGKDEIAQMSLYFNNTLEKIRKMVINIKQNSETLSGIGEELSSHMAETASAINQITTNIQSIKGRVINQSASVTETNATMEQITVNIDKLSGHVEKQALSVAQSSSAIEEMLANIQSVTQTLVKNSENVNGLTETSEAGYTGLQDVASGIQAISQES